MDNYQKEIREECQQEYVYMDNYQKEIREECQQEYIWTTIKKK